jgi:hypothetical protein
MGWQWPASTAVQVLLLGPTLPKLQPVEVHLLPYSILEVQVTLC